MNDVQVGPAQPNDVGAVERLLEAAALPTVGIAKWMDSAVVARAGGRVVGCAALETYESGVLLRSVAVDPDFRGRGLGVQLTEAALALARQKGATVAFLLTTTASNFFPRFGFVPVERADVPDDVKQSVEFRSACPSSALAMRAYLGGA